MARIFIIIGSETCSNILIYCIIFQHGSSSSPSAWSSSGSALIFSTPLTSASLSLGFGPLAFAFAAFGLEATPGAFLATTLKKAKKCQGYF